MVEIRQPRWRRFPGGALAPAAPALALAVLLGACEQTRETLGLVKQIPDEYQVVAHPPLSMPPDINLRPPRPGAPRPQETAPSEQARRSLFPGRAAATQGSGEVRSRGETALLRRAGALGANATIRDVVNRESAQLATADNSFVDRLMFWRSQPPPGQVVDPAKESRRLGEAAAEGRPVTEGEVPVIVRRKRAPLEGVFTGLFEGIF